MTKSDGNGALRRRRGRRVAGLFIGLALAGSSLPIAATDSSPKAGGAGGTPKASLTKLVPDLTPVSDYSGSFRERSTVLGDFGGDRQRLYEKGVTFDAGVTQVYQDVASGGLDEGDSKYHGLAKYGLTLDTGKLDWWPGGLIVANAYTSFGKAQLGFTGGLSPVNFNALLPTADPSDTFVIDYYLTQALSKSTVINAGRFNPVNFLDNTRFSADATTQFLNASMNHNLLVGEFISFSTYGAILSHRLNENVSLVGAVWDPNTAPTSYGANGGLFDEVGTAVGAAFAWKTASGLGGTFTPLLGYSSADTADIDNPYFLPDLLSGSRLPSKSDNWVILITADQALWKPASAGTKRREQPAHQVRTAAYDYQERGLGLFFRFAYTPEDRNPYNMFVSAGIGGRGVIPGRPYDRMGIGMYGLLESPDFDRLPGNLLDDEFGFEAYYNFALTPAILFGFDVQWIDPALTPVDDAVVVGTRLTMQF